MNPRARRLRRIRRNERTGSLFRIFVQDVGMVGFSRSGFGDVAAPSAAEAIDKATGGIERDKGGFVCLWGRRGRLIALPHDRQDLWPDGKTGNVPAEAFSFR